MVFEYLNHIGCKQSAQIFASEVRKGCSSQEEIEGGVQGNSQEISPTNAGVRGIPRRGHCCCRLRMGQPMAVHPNRQLIDWAGAGYFPGSGKWQ